MTQAPLIVISMINCNLSLSFEKLDTLGCSSITGDMLFDMGRQLIYTQNVKIKPWLNCALDQSLFYWAFN